MSEEKSIEELRISELLFHLKMTSRGLFDINTGLRNSAENSAPYNHVKNAITELGDKRVKLDKVIIGLEKTLNFYALEYSLTIRERAVKLSLEATLKEIKEGGD